MSKNTSRTSLMAALGVIVVLGCAVAYGPGNSFLSLGGMIIVVGGSIANAFLSYQREDVMTAFATIRQMLDKTPPARSHLHEDIRQLITWAYVVKERDMLGLEKAAAKTSDPLLRYGIDLVVTGYSSDKIREMLHTVADAEFERRCTPVTVLRNMAATAPAFGMVGTLIGMVVLLRNVGADIAGIGGGLSIAMLSTLYGILSARLLCLPAADKLLQKEEAGRFRNYMLTEGVAMLAEKQNPFYMQDKLNSFLSPTKHLVLENSQHMAIHRRFAEAA